VCKIHLHHKNKIIKKCTLCNVRVVTVNHPFLPFFITSAFPRAFPSTKPQIRDPKDHSSSCLEPPGHLARLSCPSPSLRVCPGASLQVDNVHFREIRRILSIHNPHLAVKCSAFVANPNVLAKDLCAPNFIIAYPQIIPWDPDCRSSGSQCIVQKGMLSQNVSLLGS
jgi:hypothetical protein